MGKCLWGVRWQIQHGKKIIHACAPSIKGIPWRFFGVYHKVSLKTWKFKQSLPSLDHIWQHLSPCNFIIGKKIAPQGHFFHVLACTLKTLWVMYHSQACNYHTHALQATHFLLWLYSSSKGSKPPEGIKWVWTCFWEGSYSDIRQGGGKPRGTCISGSNAQVAGRLSLHEGSICSKQKLAVFRTLNHMEEKSQVGSRNGWRPGDIDYWLPNSTGKMFSERSVEPVMQSWSTVIKAK